MELDKTTLNKMIFVFNAINSGWIVRKINEKTYEFKKSRDTVGKEIELDTFLKDFVSDNLDISKILS